MSERATVERSRLDTALLLLVALLPVMVTAAGAGRVATPAHDEATVRVVGFGTAGLWRGVEAAWAAPWMALPLGTRAYRAALASGAAAGLLAALVFSAARRTIAAVSGPATTLTARRLAGVTAATGAVLATLGGAGQVEALGPGGSALGAALALAPAWALARGRDGETLAALLLGLAASYQPDVLVCGAAGAAAMFALARRDGASHGSPGASGPARSTLVRAGLAFAAGLAPLAWAAWRRGTATALFASVPAWASPLGERGESARSSAGALLHEQLGVVALGLALLGAAVGLARARSRPPAAAALAIALAGAAAMALGAPAGPTRFGAATLATIAACSWLTAVGMFVAADWVRGARVPFAAGSAAMVVLLEIAVAAKSADDGSLEAAARTSRAARAFDASAWGGVEVRGVVTTDDPRVALRAVALRASGELRGDLAVFFSGDAAGPAARLELFRDSRLSGYVRDVALYGAPEEFCLSQVAAARPLVTTFDPRWNRRLATHLVPDGLFDRYWVEPRGSSDRTRARADSRAALESLRAALDAAPDPEVERMAAALLRRRALAALETRDRDWISAVLDDLRAASPKDPVAGRIVRWLESPKAEPAPGAAALGLDTFDPGSFRGGARVRGGASPGRDTTSR